MPHIKINSYQSISLKYKNQDWAELCKFNSFKGTQLLIFVFNISEQKPWCKIPQIKPLSQSLHQIKRFSVNPQQFIKINGKIQNCNIFA